jgi:hypothetical protein
MISTKRSSNKMKKVQYTTRTGLTQWKPVLDKNFKKLVEEDGNVGFCLACGHDQLGCEPDARKYQCENCDAPKVYGLEELVMMGLVR